MKKYIGLVVVLVLVSFVFADVASAARGYGGGSRKAGASRPGFGGNAGQVLGAATYAFNSDLAQGTSGDAVRELQERLRALGFFTFPTSTGFFGPITLAAVKAFQTANGIPATGFVGPLTRAALNL